MPDLDGPDQWYKDLVSPALTRRLLELCRDEDLGPDHRDTTGTLMVARSERGEAWIVTREAGIVCGLSAIGDILDVFATTTLFRGLVRDGDAVEPGQRLGALLGPRREILAAERTLLNLLGRLSGVATLTKRYVDAVAGSKAQVVDTRKTNPGLRHLEKYAVRCGGGRSHRMGLYDAVLVKDNHLAGLNPANAAAKVAGVAELARAEYAPAFIEVEVDTLDQLEAMLGLEEGVIDIVLLDNMPAELLAKAVELRDRAGSRVLLEASGGITLDSIGDTARSGVDRIALGAITHQAVWLDIGLDAGPSIEQPT
ncbi:MAG: carboxylating nicotinate-nucleotide diphosphorylase [Phycisphaerales bacterium]|nr:carboxylating nicotinate-nucleotide diphosphorylase [Phycisphaerales bacterium]